ncbi:hypothetical protein EDC94DRAFT_532610 [Helicostylum pulchrum]|uniref:RhoGAP-domain-containing protein n=1 Tax=Helicostylum pulchrum TaxID=562976 RepID=A0ABP9XV01_9FUNG|nr:hypothetical protein EDC94DRAFT_532610 [Helicostylum pulchrum]
MTTEEITVPNCQGCSNSIEEGAVVAFGDSLFHVKCFICAKCEECVDSKTNLLLLDDGRPVCDNCSYNCTACQKVIKDEAIMTGEKAYHSSCFKCIACKKSIEDLIFTQTAKGIYCTKCYDIRKAEKIRRKNKLVAASEANNTSPPKSQVRKETPHNPARLPTPEPSSSTSTSFLSDLSPFTLSFFDNESSDLANLSSSLGANLSFDKDSSKSINSTQSRINRASEILKSSLRSSSLKPSEFKEHELNTTDINKLKQELSESRSRLQDVETNYKSLQHASEQALNEFTKVKEDFTKESQTQQQLELVIASLLKKNGGILSRKEIERVAQLRVGLERTCKDMINYRDKIGVTLDENATKQEISAFYTTYQKGLQTQVKSLISERDLLQHETKTLRKTREEIIREMVLLNVKNTELANLNNDLSKRALEQEDTVVLNVPQRFTPPPLSPSISTESSLSLVSRTRKPSDASSIMCNVSSRNSFIKDQTPKIFSIKKKTSTMFNKLAGAGATSTPKTIKPEPSLSSSSSSIYGSSKSSIYSNNNFNSSLQSLHQESRSISKNKGFMDSTASLQIMPSHHGGTSSHSFQPMSFLRPVKCGACGDKIWGRSEYRCDCCGFSSHSRCLSKVPQNCLSANASSNLDLTSEYYHSTTNLSMFGNHEKSSSSAPAKKSISESSMFGFDLSERCQMENRTVPTIVDACIKAVESRGLEYEGIYRKSGGAAQMRAIQLAFDQGEKINLCDEEEYNDFCAITSVLKQYFRELPNPLLTFEHYDSFIAISSMNPDEKKITAFADTLGKLPKAHLDTIILLFQHLDRVFKRSDENRMTVKNLSMVFAPTLMRHSDPSRDFLDISYKNATIEYILLHSIELFSLVNINT